MRLLHVGDVHLRAGDHLDDVEACLAFVARLAAEREVDAILLPGDLYERASTPIERQAVIRWLRQLDAAGWHGPIILCDGNHDAPHDLGVWQVVDQVHVSEQPEMLTLLRTFHGTTECHPGGSGVFVDAGEETVDVLMVPWPRRAYLASRGYTGEGQEAAGGAALADLIRLQVAARPDPGRPLVIAGHMSVTGARVSSGQPLIGGEIQIGAAQLVETGAYYVAPNHIHRHQEMAPGVVYAGSLSCHDHGEEGEVKGVVIVDVGPGQPARWEFVPTPCRVWATVEAVVLDGIISEHHNQTATYDLVDAYAGAVVRYRYRCTEAEAALFDHDAIRRRFAAAHSLTIVPEITRTERVRAAAVAEARTVAAKLATWAEATGTTVPPSAAAKLRQLEEGA